MAQLNFDATSVKPATLAAGMLPVSDSSGWPVMIVDSVMKPTQSGDGAFLALTLQIFEGEHEGATCTYRLNLVNSNDKAVEIAQRELSAICHVTGVIRVSDSSELHGIAFRAIVGSKKKKDPSEPDYTEVKGVKDYEGNNPGEKVVAATPKGKPTFETDSMPQMSAPAWQMNKAPAEQAPAEQAASIGKPAWAK